jgi:hypothetical protein
MKKNRKAKFLSLLVAALSLSLFSCGEHRDFIVFGPIEAEVRLAIHENKFNNYLDELNGDAAVRLSALMLNEETFSYAAWGLTHITLRSNSPVLSKWTSAMARPDYEEAIISTSLEEAITALSMFYPEGIKEYERISADVHIGMPWSDARTLAGRLFGLTCLYYRERLAAGKPPMNFEFTDIPGRTRRIKHRDATK